MKVNWKSVKDSLNEPAERDLDWVIIKMKNTGKAGLFYDAWRLYLVKTLDTTEDPDFKDHEEWFEGWDYIEE